MNLAKVIELDIETRFKSHVIKDVYVDIANHYQSSIQDANRRSLDPDGTEREPLSDTEPYFYRRNKMNWVGNGDPNLILSGEAEGSLGIYDTEDGFEMYHSGRPDEYMYLHETGTGGMPERRQFPTNEDSQSSFQAQNVDFVRKTIEQHLNKKRRIIVNG